MLTTPGNTSKGSYGTPTISGHAGLTANSSFLQKDPVLTALCSDLTSRPFGSQVKNYKSCLHLYRSVVVVQSRDSYNEARVLLTTVFGLGFVRNRTWIPNRLILMVAILLGVAPEVFWIYLQSPSIWTAMKTVTKIAPPL